MLSRLKSHLLHYAMKNSMFSSERTTLVAQTQGRVLEVCFETDKNLPYYSPWVTELSLASFQSGPAGRRETRTDHGLRVERFFLAKDSTTLPFEDSHFDWVVSTLALCRLKPPGAILTEIRRVLKPSGAYAFLEHGRGSDREIGVWKMLLKRCSDVAGGCEPALQIDVLVDSAGFSVDKLERYALGRPKFLSSMYRGRARPA